MIAEILKRKIQDGTYEPDLDALARFCGKQVLKDDDALNARGLPLEELAEEMTSLLEGMPPA